MKGVHPLGDFSKSGVPFWRSDSNGCSTYGVQEPDFGNVECGVALHGYYTGFRTLRCARLAECA